MMSASVLGQTLFDFQGHRGCRGVMPENSLPAFFHAIELGFSTLEMDVVISGDGEIVVSHEPWMSWEICSHPDGRPVKKGEKEQLNLYKMPYTDIQKYDCGMRFHPRFPDQNKIHAIKPALKMVVRSVERFAREGKYALPAYNIEIKSDPRLYGRFQPEPGPFVEKVVTEIRRLGIEDVTTLQSFDHAVLEELNRIPERGFKISYLVARGKKVTKNLARLSFKPDIYSPLYTLLTPESIGTCHTLNIKVIPWTVNTASDISRLKSWGCDGVISDYYFPVQ